MMQVAYDLRPLAPCEGPLGGVEDLPAPVERSFGAPKNPVAEAALPADHAWVERLTLGELKKRLGGYVDEKAEGRDAAKVRTAIE